MAQGESVLTVMVAVYGAIVSTIVAAWNIYRQITDRGRLKIIVSIAEMYQPGVGQIAKDRLWCKVVNAGSKPIWLTQIGGGLSNGKHFLITIQRQFPIKLEPGETFDDATADANKVLGGPNRVIFIGAWDTLGSIHKLPRRRLRALLREQQSKT